MNRRRLSPGSLAWAGTLLLATGCAVVPARHREKTPWPLPAEYAGAAGLQVAPAGADHRQPWWRELKDPDLEALIERALSGNLDLKRAWARLAAARAVAIKAGSPLWPELTASGDSSYTRSATTGGGFSSLGGSAAALGNASGLTGPSSTFPGGGSRSVTTSKFYSLNLAASYELDLWGRVRAGRRAARHDWRASREDLEAMALSLSGQVAEVWYAVVEQRAQLTLLARQTKVNETLHQLALLRFSQGQASAVDVFQQRQQLAATRAQAPLVRSRRQVLEHQLAVLLGLPPGRQVGGSRMVLPLLPALPGPGAPLRLLQRRPDVRAAFLRLRAADQRVAAALADRFPAFRLSGRGGYRSDELRDFFSSWVENVAAGILAPVVDGRRRAAEVDRVRAVAEELTQAYAQTVLKAMQEVEDALVQERRQRDHLKELEEQMKSARTELSESRSRYINGLTEYLPVLTALRRLQELERTLLSARRQLLTYRIALYRALGGSWTRTLKPVAEVMVSLPDGEK